MSGWARNKSSKSARVRMPTLQPASSTHRTPELRKVRRSSTAASPKWSPGLRSATTRASPSLDITSTWHRPFLSRKTADDGSPCSKAGCCGASRAGRLRRRSWLNWSGGSCSARGGGGAATDPGPTRDGPTALLDMSLRSREAESAGARHTELRYESSVKAFCSCSRGTASSSTGVAHTTETSCDSPTSASYPNWSPGPKVRSRARSPVDDTKEASSEPEVTR
mmetsp:Transcript_36856/g.118610  ORF Transcript_36856/g.118610 Transcript_36856/m.118610 type:complete len:223 (-) Transcript_36856:2233-2901(-)